MRNWHKRLIQIPQNVTGNNVVIGVIDVGLLEFVRKNTSNVDPVLFPPNYKVAHPTFDDNIGTQESRVFLRKNDEDQYMSTEKINIDNVVNFNFVKEHLSSVAGIIVGKQVANNFIAGIAPNATLINAQNVIDAFILTNTHTYALKNSDPKTAYYYSDKRVRKNLMIPKEVPSGSLTPDNEHSKKSASIINLSFSWKTSGEDTPEKIGNPNEKECQFMLNEIFAYSRNGRGALIIASAGNGNSDNSQNIPIGIELKQENNFIRASNKAIMVAASSIDTTGFDANPNAHDSLDDLTEIHSQYSNYGEKTVDICAPSTPTGILDEKSLGIFAPTMTYCGEIGFNEQYITINVIQRVGQSQLKLENTFGIMTGQSVDIGNMESFTNEIRYIVNVDRVNNIITLNRNCFFTKNISITKVKILVLKKKGKKSLIPTEINKIILDEIGIAIAKGQEVYIYGSNISAGIYSKIIYKSFLKIELQNVLSVFALGEELTIIPGVMKAKLERTGGGAQKGKYKFIENDDISGFFNGQLIKILDGDKEYIYDLTEVNHNTKEAEITLYRLPPNGSIIKIESLSYGHYTSKFGGTSAAAPIVSGVASLLLSANSQLNSAEIKHILKFTADKIGGVNEAANYKLQNDLLEYDYGYFKHENFGTGRVNAAEAVKLALRWHTDNSVEKPKMCFPKSPNVPDIWVSEKTNVIANSTNLYNTLNTSQNQNIFVRVKNEGNRHSFQETDLRVLVAFTNETNPALIFPDCWHQNTDSTGVKTILLDVQEVKPIAPGVESVLKVDWKKLSKIWEEYNPDGTIRTYLLAHIAPFDGLDNELDPIDYRNNKNLACVEIIPQFAKISKISTTGEAIPLTGEQNSYNLLASDTQKQESFRIDLNNILTADLQSMQFKFKLVNKLNSNIESEAIIKKTNGNWDFSNLPNWLAVGLTESNSVLYTATHKNAVLDYTLSYDNTDKEINFEVVTA